MVCWFFRIALCSYYIYSILCFVFTLLPNDRAQAIPADSGTAIEPTHKTNKNRDFVFAPIMTTMSTESNTYVRYKFCISLSFYYFHQRIK